VKAWLAKHHGVGLENVVVFGDGLNDVEMLQQSGRGVAMANACEAAKRVANVTSVYSNAESAVAKECTALVSSGRLGGKLLLQSL
jgi:hydroxymethylpyrimidine pyrophosphatase-like HAD family hydrolase